MTRSRALRLAAVAVGVAGFAIACSADAEVARRREFVESFVRSVMADTEFHRAHADGDGRSTREARPLITAQYRIAHVDRIGWLWVSQYEYYLEFDNGASAILYVAERDGELRGVLSVWGEPVQPGEESSPGDERTPR